MVFQDGWASGLISNLLLLTVFGTLPVQLRILASAVPVLAVVDTILHDNHGLPCLLGMVLGFLLLLHPERS